MSSGYISGGKAPAKGSVESVFRHVDWFTVVLYLLLVTAGVFSI